MGNVIKLVSDGHGLAVAGNGRAIERFLKQSGLSEVAVAIKRDRAPVVFDTGSALA